MNQSTRSAFLAIVKDKMAQAEQMFGVDMSDVAIELNIRGNRISGQACPPRWKRGKRLGYRIRFNPAAIVECFDELVKRTVGHEVAHMVCFKRPELGRNHDRGWKRIDIALGGDGSRCHSMKFGQASTRTRKQYAYKTTSGQQVVLSSVRHNRIQTGTIYVYGKDRSKIKSDGYIGLA
jgi:predicted SprT family Zn-dependent metalloprotease